MQPDEREDVVPRIQTQVQKNEDQEHPALGASAFSVVIGSSADRRDDPTGGSS